MSFRSDDLRRYGHIPPVQYPVQAQPQGVARRPSFSSGDETAFSEHSHYQPQPAVQSQAQAMNAQGFRANVYRNDEELFLTSPVGTLHGRGGPNVAGISTAAEYPLFPSEPTPTSISPLSQPSYNNARQVSITSSASLPYHTRVHSSPSRRTSVITSGSPPTSYTPPTYNPAAYAITINAPSPPRQSNPFGASLPYASQTHPQSYAQPYPQSYTQPYPQTYAQPNSHAAPTYNPQAIALAYSTFTPSSSNQSTNDQQVTSYGTPSLSYAPHIPSPQDSFSPVHNAAYSAPQRPYQLPIHTTNGISPMSQRDPPLLASRPQQQPQPPYPLESQIPVGPNYDHGGTDSFSSRAARAEPQSSTHSAGHHQLPALAGLQRHPTNAPLPSRPMDDLPEESVWENYYANSREQQNQENIMHDIEAELAYPRSHQTSFSNGTILESTNTKETHRRDSTATAVPPINSSSGTALPPARLGRYPPTGYYENNGSELPGDIATMQQAAVDSRPLSSLHSLRSPPPPTPPPKDNDHDSNLSGFTGMDLGLISGGYAGNLSYGDQIVNLSNSGVAFEKRPSLGPAPNSFTSSNYDGAFSYPVDVDDGGIGGLQEPSAKRMAYEEAGEDASLHSRQSESDGCEEYPDLFYHPGLSSRPLPALPPAHEAHPALSLQIPGRSASHGHSRSVDSRPAAPQGPDSFYNSVTLSQQVERSISLNTHNSTPSVHTPMRSRTDATDDRRRHNRHQSIEGYDPGTPPDSLAYDMIMLPDGRKRKFVPSKLTPADIRKCSEPWALSSIADWIRDMAQGEYYLTTKTIEEGLITLFTAKVPTMHVANAESLSATVVNLMLEACFLEPEEEWVKFGGGYISGVLWQLTGAGCYAPRLHSDESPYSGRCYAYHCARTLKKAILDDMGSKDIVPLADWTSFWKLSSETIKEKPQKEVTRQNILHEIVTSEETYMNQLDVLRTLYRDKLRLMQPPIIAPNKLDKFLTAVFGKVDIVYAVNKDFLLAQLKYRQQEKGPWITGFSDLFREWIRKARNAYVLYAGSFPYATYLVRKEADRNILFSRFLEEVRSNKRSYRLDWTTFLKAPITRLQRYSFLLETVRKASKEENEELTNLIKAIEEIHAVTLECDQKVAEKTKEVDMMELNAMLVLRPGFLSMLHLDHLGREVIMQGDLTRMGSKGVRWVETHALLFDHYLILAKVVTPKDGRGEKKYDVSKEPIPMLLLFLESTNDDPVLKQKSITAPLSRNAVSASDVRLSKVTVNAGDRSGPEDASPATPPVITAVTRLAPGNAVDDGKILFPFKVKHLGHEVYTLYAHTSQSRHDWCNAITKTKERHALALWTQNAEPFKLRVLADCAFAYDSTSAAGKAQAMPTVKGSPLDRALREMEESYLKSPRPMPICKASVNCATAFVAFGKPIIAIGTDYGVFITSLSDPRGWIRTVTVLKVTQIALLEELSVCIIIADRSLIAFPLDMVVPASDQPPPANDNAKRAPTRLAKDVSFFATARMKDRVLVFYKKKEGLHSTFKVLEPVFQKETEKKSRLFGRSRGYAPGSTESFRDFDEFYLPTECFSLNIFQTYIAVSTAKGFEMLTLDKKQPVSVPDLKDPAIVNVAARVRDLRPLGMFKLNDHEYLLAYEECAVYVDRHGDVSRTLIMEFSGKQKKARRATMFGPYLILFNEDYVEVRNAENGRLRQIISGRNLRCLDYGFRGPTGGPLTPNGAVVPGLAPGPGLLAPKLTVKIAMAHPEVQGTQLVLELVLKDGHDDA